jgi:hypothetical protein
LGLKGLVVVVVVVGGSTKVVYETTDIGRSVFYPASGLSNTFRFNIQDKQGRMHIFNCGLYPHLYFMLAGVISFSFFLPIYVQMLYIDSCVFLFSDTSSLTDLITSILQRVGDDIDRKNLPQILVLIKIVPLFYNHIMFLKSFPSTV